MTNATATTSFSVPRAFYEYGISYRTDMTADAQETLHSIFTMPEKTSTRWFLRGWLADEYCYPFTEAEMHLFRHSSESLVRQIAIFLDSPSYVEQDPEDNFYYIRTSPDRYTDVLYPLLSEESFQEDNSYDLIYSLPQLKIWTDSFTNHLVKPFRAYHIHHRLPRCSFARVSDQAVIPTKGHPSDAGYDLTIIAKAKDFNSTTTLYDTGIQLNIEPGWYAEIVPRSSLSKSGYMLANSIGIIDQTYHGNLYIALTKTDPEAPPIQLPFRACQLLFRPQVHVLLKEVPPSEIAHSSRGAGGFGSTGR